MPEGQNRKQLAAYTGLCLARKTDVAYAHLAEPLSPVKLAELVRLSPRHFTRAFKEPFNLPPHRYHLARRIDRAKELFRKDEMSISEIALALGFPDTSAFSTTFRRLTGVCPRITAAPLRTSANVVGLPPPSALVPGSWKVGNGGNSGSTPTSK